MERNNGWMRVRFEGPNDLHFIPPISPDFSFMRNGRTGRWTYNDRTRAAVVDVLERWTNLTAIFWSETVERLPEREVDFGRHSQTLPQLPKPI